VNFAVKICRISCCLVRHPSLHGQITNCIFDLELSEKYDVWEWIKNYKKYWRKWQTFILKYLLTGSKKTHFLWRLCQPSLLYEAGRITTTPHHTGMQNRYRSSYNSDARGFGECGSVGNCISGIEFVQQVHVCDYHAYICNHNVVWSIYYFMCVRWDS
jgi:hypothetical protein